MKPVVIVLLVTAILIGCSPAAAPTPAPSPTSPPPTAIPTPTAEPIPESFKTQLTSFIKAGSKLTALSKQGVNYGELRNAVADVQSEYDLTTATWPAGFPTKAQQSFKKAFTAWKYTIDLWRMKIDDSDEPVEPNVNGYKAITDFAGDLLVYDTHPKTFIVEEYRYKKFLPFDENIGVLLAIASEAFDKGKQQVMDALK